MGPVFPPRTLRRMDLDKHMHLLCLKLLKRSHPFVILDLTYELCLSQLGGFTLDVRERERKEDIKERKQNKQKERNDLQRKNFFPSLILHKYYIRFFKKFQIFFSQDFQKIFHISLNLVYILYQKIHKKSKLKRDEISFIPQK